MTLTFQILSDIHIEYQNDLVPDPMLFVKPSADILILAGDIGSLYKFKQLTDFLTVLCPYFKATLYVPGNHEFYTQDNYRNIPFEELKERLYSLQNLVPKLYILDKSSILLNDVLIIGTTLWSHSRINIPKFIVRIHDFNTDIYNKTHQEELLYIEEMIKFAQQKNYKLVVITHHCPSYSVLKEVKFEKKDKYKSLYVTNLDYLLSKQKIHTWICGHIHQNFDFFTENGTRIVGNQRGKPKDKINNYKLDYLVEIN
jgi:predicted phosphohydrolase